MAVTTVRPNENIAGANLYTVTPSGSAAWQVLSDDSTATSIQRTSTTATGNIILGLGTFSVGSAQKIKQVRARVQLANPTATSRVSVALSTSRTDTATYATGPAYVIAGQYASATFTGPYYAQTPDGQTWSQTTLNNLRLNLTDFAVSGGDRATIYELYADVDLASQPTASVTAPSGVLTTSPRPTVEWTYSDADGDPQTYFRVKVFTEAQYSAAGFNPETAVGLYDSGDQTGSDLSTVVGDFLQSGLYRAYVKVAKTVNAEPFYSDWVFSDFSISLTPPAAPLVSGNYDQALNKTEVTVSPFGLRGARTNLVRNPSFETNTDYISGTDANSIATRSASAAYIGDFGVVWTNVGATASRALRLSASPSTFTGLPVNASSTYTVSVFCRPQVTSRSVLWTWRWLDSDGSQIGGALQATVLTIGQQALGQWRRAVSTRTAPDNAASLDIRLILTNFEPTDRYDLDAFLVEEVSGALSYFDGSFLGGSWNGTPHASTSTLPAYASQELEVQRSDDGGTNWIDVRDAQDVTPNITPLGTRTNLIPNPSFEVDTTGWTASGTAGAISSTTAAPYIGNSVITHTTTASGTARVVSDNIAVSPNLPYTVSAFCIATVNANRTAFIDLEWLNSSASVISTSLGSELVMVAGGVWTYNTSTATAPSDAAFARVILRNFSPTASQVFRWDAIMLEQSASAGYYFDGSYVNAAWNGTANNSTSTLTLYNTRENLVQNPSFEVGIAYWTNVNTASITVTSSAAFFGSQSLEVTATGTTAFSGTVLGAGARRPRVFPSTQYTASFYLQIPSGSPSRTVRVNLRALNSTQNAALNEVAVDVPLTAGGGWTRASLTLTTSASAAFIDVYPYWETPVVGDRFLIDGVMIEQGSTLGTYFDGDTAGAGWSVGANNGPSTLTFFPTTVTDHEAPRDQSVLYRARAIATTTTDDQIASNYTTSDQIAVTSDGTYWIKAVDLPSLNANGFRILTNVDVTQEQTLGVFKPIGRETTVVVLGDLYGEDGKYQIVTQGESEWDSLYDLITHEGILLVQYPFQTQKYLQVTSRNWTSTGGSQNIIRDLSLDYVVVDPDVSS